MQIINEFIWPVIFKQCEFVNVNTSLLYFKQSTQSGIEFPSKHSTHTSHPAQS